MARLSRGTREGVTRATSFVRSNCFIYSSLPDRPTKFSLIMINDVVNDAEGIVDMEPSGSVQPT